ncbi:hypothetical protein [Caulobacter sp. BK020]|uniref:hypothetical protein n=1 Tax=Caulobacter sp. BK020 TaxID=2512117 RepID=UPI001051AB21|nr:hypothetical protein [Caulobacter sp. BK020]TCS14542.1 hypothetical protein EV278_107191 [Caulobacter sp. BK020]
MAEGGGEAQMITAGISAIGSMLGGVGQFMASRGQARALRRGAAQARREAGVRAGLALEEGDRAAAQAAVNAAAGGGGLTGSALGALDDLASSAMFNARSAIYEGVTEGRNLDYQAKVAKKQGGLALVTNWLQAGGSAGSALGDMQQRRAARLEAARTRSWNSQPSGFDNGRGLY